MSVSLYEPICSPILQLSPGFAAEGRARLTGLYVLSGGFHDNSSEPGMIGPRVGETRCQEYEMLMGSNNSLRVSHEREKKTQHAHSVRRSFAI